MCRRCISALCVLSALILRPAPLTLVNSSNVFAQLRDKPGFEVVSVKPSAANSGLSLRPKRSGDRVTWRGAPQDFIVEYAYNVGDYEISGALTHSPYPSYDIEALAPAGASEQDVRRMFQTLLQDRFALKVHYEKREMPVYELVVGPKGHRLKASQEETRIIVGGKPVPENAAGVYLERDGNHLAGKNASMAELAKALSGALGRPVVDQTAITGTFDFDALHAPEDSPLGVTEQRPPVNAPSLKTAIEDELGLRVQSARRPVQILVIDRIDKPTPN